jgi:hypothetical protein
MNEVATQKVTSDQIKAIHAKLPWHCKHDKENKADLVEQFTGDPTRRSTTQLTYDEANQMICSLYGGADYFALFDSKNKQHMNVLSLCHQLGWIKLNRATGKAMADLNVLGKFIKDRSKAKKPLKLMSSVEVNNLINQLEQIVRKSGKKG